METLGGVFTKMIERNTTVPTRKSEIFSTAQDGQSAVDIMVFQGERPMAKDNMLLGQFRLEGIPPAPRGVPQVDVTFDIDANGILNVTAKDLGSGKEQNVTIHASTTLSKEQVDQMVKEAEEHADDDRARAEEVETRNRADTLLYQTERTLKDLGEDDIPEEDRTAVESALENLREALKGEDTASINAAVEEVQQASMKIGEAMYAKAGAAQGEDGDPVGAAAGPQASNGDGGDDTVVDAEFRATDEADADEKGDASEGEKR